jgi:hypothetical protein
VLVAPLVLAPLKEREGSGAWRPALVAGGVAYGVVVGAVAVLDLGGFFAGAFTLPAVGAGLGVFNLFGYWGGEGSAVARVAAGFVPLVAIGFTAWLMRQGESVLALAGLAALAWVGLAPSISADAVGVPIVLLGLAAVWEAGDRDAGDAAGGVLG